MKGALLGISAAVSWGSGDFCGGLATKRANVFGAVVVSHFFCIFVFAAAAWLLNEPWEGSRVAIWGAAAGVTGGAALLVFYRALAVGRMSVIAPLSAVLTAVIPVAIGFATLGLPTLLQLLGFAIAFVAVALISTSAEQGGGRRGFFLAMLSGVGFGFFLVLLQRGGSTSPLWLMTCARTASTLVVGSIALFTQRDWMPPAQTLPLVLAAGLFDALGNFFYVLATHFGRADVAAVLASLYPASTVILARLVLKERMTRIQLGGVAAAFLAIALIAT